MRKNFKKGDSGRVAGGFVALPWQVLDSAAYARLSHPARALLIELARQLGRDNNGQLLTSTAYLSKRGWRSRDVIHRAMQELLSANLIHQTVQGCRPNKASWFAVTWQRLASNEAGFDAGTVETFRRGAFADADPLPTPKPTRQDLYDRWNKNASLSPSPGLEKDPIDPPPGLEPSPPSPSGGLMGAIYDHQPSPSGGHHLDIAICSRQSEPVSDPVPDGGGAPAARKASKARTKARRFREGSACARLHDALVAGPKTTAELEAAGIAKPQQRVFELRGRGYRIDLDAERRYVLVTAGAEVEAAP